MIDPNVWITDMLPLPSKNLTSSTRKKERRAKGVLTGSKMINIFNPLVHVFCLQTSLSAIAVGEGGLRRKRSDSAGILRNLAIRYAPVARKRCNVLKLQVTERNELGCRLQD